MLHHGISAYVDESLYHESGVLRYGEGKYFAMMNERPKFFEQLLNLGVDFLFCDADVVTIHNFIPDIRSLFDRAIENGHPLPDLIGQTDKNLVDFDQVTSDHFPEVCGGFFFLRNGPNARRLIHDMKVYLGLAQKFDQSGENDQYALNYFIHDPSASPPRKTYIINDMPRVSHARPQDPDLVVYFLDQIKYPNGHILFNHEKLPPLCQAVRRGSVPYIFHANACKDKFQCLERFSAVLVDRGDGADGKCLESFNEDQFLNAFCPHS